MIGGRGIISVAQGALSRLKSWYCFQIGSIDFCSKGLAWLLPFPNLHGPFKVHAGRIRARRSRPCDQKSIDSTNSLVKIVCQHSQPRIHLGICQQRDQEAIWRQDGRALVRCECSPCRDTDLSAQRGCQSSEDRRTLCGSSVIA